MNNKYQEALDNVKIAPSFMGGNTKYSTHINSATLFSEDISILQELVEQNKEYTLEKIKKMWEELGYEWAENPDASLIILRNKKQDIKIKINTFLKTYYAREYSCFDYQDIEFQEHQLLTKTFKALEKEEKHDYS